MLYNFPDYITDVLVRWTRRVAIFIAMIVMLLAGYFFGSLETLKLGTFSNLELLVSIWFGLSSFALLLVFSGWLLVAIYTGSIEVYSYYRGYKEKVIYGGEGRPRELFSSFRELFGEEMIPEFAKWIYFIYSWPLVLLIFLLALLALFLGLIGRELVLFLDRLVKNWLVKKYLVHALSSENKKIRTRAQRMIERKKHSKRRKP